MSNKLRRVVCNFVIELILADRLAKREIIQLEQDIAERQQLLGIPSTDGMSCRVGAEADHMLSLNLICI